MFGIVKRGLASAAALAVISMGVGARADTVQYYTVGFFANDPVPVTTGSNHYSFDSWTDGKTSLTFMGQTDNTIPGVGPNTTTARLGSFNASGAANAPDTITNLKFTLDLFQFGLTKSELIGQFNGTVTDTTSAFGNATLAVTFSPNSFPAVPGSTFAFTVNSSTILASGSNPANTTLDGTVINTPLPTTASAGLVALAGLGAFGGLKKLRERNAASTATV